jgi:hypothetical protein
MSMPRKFTIAIAAVAFAHVAAAAPAADAVPGQAAAPKTDLSDQTGSLSQKLNRTNGVIRPEGAVDPAMEKPAPAAGATPVIRPPSAPDAQPK